MHCPPAGLCHYGASWSVQSVQSPDHNTFNMLHKSRVDPPPSLCFDWFSDMTVGSDNRVQNTERKSGNETPSHTLMCKMNPH